MTTRYNNSDSEKRTQTTPTTIGQASPPMPCSWMTFRTSCGPGVVRTLGTRMLALWCVRVCVCVCVLYEVGGTRTYCLMYVVWTNHPPLRTTYRRIHSYLLIPTSTYSTSSIFVFSRSLPVRPVVLPVGVVVLFDLPLWWCI